jgi:hypothetical protein
VHDAQCVVYRGPDVEHFGREICFLSTESEVRIVDVTDAYDGGGDVTLSLLAYEGASYAHQGWLTCDHTTLFVDDELDEYYDGHGTKTFVLDVADLDAPRVRFVHTADTAFIDHNQYVNGAFLYQANYAGGLRILDISNAELDGGELTEVAHFDLVPSKQGRSWDGAWNVYPFLASGRVVVNSINSGMAIVKPTNLLVETRSRRVTARGADDVCPNLFQERSCEGDGDFTASCASAKKKTKVPGKLQMEEREVQSQGGQVGQVRGQEKKQMPDKESLRVGQQAVPDKMPNTQEERRLQGAPYILQVEEQSQEMPRAVET